jgi:hypothetical protein
MTAQLKISQAGLSAGVAGRARTDGLATGALVTLENVGPGGVTSFHLLWGPPDDTTAAASLAVTGNPNIWTFTPTVGCHDTYLIELREDGVPIERRIFGIRTVNNHLLIPAFNEGASRHATWENDGADQVALSDNNAVDFTDPLLNALNYAGYWRSLRELYKVVEAGTGGLADHGVPFVKLPSAAAAPSVVGASANGNLVEVPLTTLAGAGLAVVGTGLDVTGSTSIVVTGDQVTRAGITGAVVLAANANTSKFAGILDQGAAENDRTNLNFLNATHVLLNVNDDSGNDELEITATLAAAAAKSVLANATNGSAVPAYLAGTAAGQYLRVNNANTALELATPAHAVKTTAQVVTSTTSLDVTGTLTANANTLVAGSKISGRAVFFATRGGTATANAINASLVMTPGTVALPVVPAMFTTAGSGYVQLVVDITILTAGAGGTCMYAFSFLTNCDATNFAAFTSAVFSASSAIDTTVTNTFKLAAAFGSNVAGCSLTAVGGHLYRDA